MKPTDKKTKPTEKKLTQLNRFLRSGVSVLWGLIFAVTLMFTFILYPETENIDLTYKKGDVAEIDIKAPTDFFIEDIEATAKNRKEIGSSVPIVYDFDANLHKKISQNIYAAFEMIHSILADEKDDRKIPLAEIMDHREKFEQTIGIPISKEIFKVLLNNDFSRKISENIKNIVSIILENGVVANKEVLLKEKGIVLRTIETGEEKIVTNLKKFYGPDQAKTMVRIIGDPILKDFNYNLCNLIVDLSQNLIQPNITLNRSETEKRIKQAELNIKPVLYKIKKGEMILREGERVDDLKLVKLNALEKQIQQKNTLVTQAGTAMVVFFCLMVFYILLLKDHKALARHHNKNIIFLSTLLVLFLAMAKLAVPIAGSINMELPVSFTLTSLTMGMPLAAGAMVVSLFLGFNIALTFSLILALLTSLLFSNCISVFIFFFLSSTAAAVWTQECRERKGFITAGLKLAVFNTVLALVLNIYSAQLDLEIISKNLIMAFTGGILAGIITAGLTPVVEIIFDYTTDIKLLELSNLDQPIMKRLMIETPGTYNHSVIVASLAEAAALEIGVSALKAKVCAFYHDIGKLGKPLYFVENQTNGKNRHDKLSPSMSALILIQHVKKGVEIAKMNKLGIDIIDTIEQHHGTSLIRYFYNKSVKLNGIDAVKEEDFRYKGPRPQTRIAGIVMLADVVEAAMRTLEKPTSARIQGKVQELVNAIFADGQLEECELTLKDLHHIAKSFNKILTGIYHHRIEYTDKPQEKKKEINGKPEHPNSAAADKGKSPRGADPQKNSGNLKRLGI
ncbi:MAG: HDIG domain-containing protein [Thermodesulfobacteriota bacterium]|nr:HDIG domain-containing protein [Thermodesulfobacteriota bacterium]